MHQIKNKIKKWSNDNGEIKIKNWRLKIKSDR